MENSYGIGIRNRYEILLDDESDPQDIIQKKEAEKKQKKKERTFENEGNKTEVPNKFKKVQNITKSAVPSTGRRVKSAKIIENTTEQVQVKSKSPRSTKERNGRGDENRDNLNQFEDKSLDLSEKPTNRNINSRGQKQRNQRRRDFDRQSGSTKSSIKPIDKKDGDGAHNWGSHNSIIADAEIQENLTVWDDNEATEATKVEENQFNESLNDGEVSTEIKEFDVKESVKLTLDEWKAQQEPQRTSKPQYNIRKPGEGEDPNKWKQMYELRKKGDQFNNFHDDEYYLAEYPQRVGRQKHLYDIKIQFNNGVSKTRNKREKMNREFRQQQYEKYSGGQENMEQSNDKVLKVDDEHDFPFLR